MNRCLPFVLSGVVVGTIGCKGDTVVKPDPHTEAELEKCKKDKLELETYKTKLESENAALMQKGSGDQIIVTIEGDLVKPIHGSFGNGGNGGTAPPLDPKSAIAFQNLVEKSRGAIQKCYNQVLKKDANIQARTITLIVSASFTATGAEQQASFNPSTPLGQGFDACMQNIAAHWQLPTNSPAMTFQAQVSLTPT
jgi:hypothetical protein